MLGCVIKRSRGRKLVENGNILHRPSRRVDNDVGFVSFLINAPVAAAKAKTLALDHKMMD